MHQLTPTPTRRERDWSGDALFLAGGKHDIRGRTRPRADGDPALGLRLRLDIAPAARELVTGAVELHLFDGGYAGIVEQERGSLNVCLALRKSRLASAGNDPHALLARLAATNPHFALRLAPSWEERTVDTIGSIPYGYIAQDTEPGLFRLGDQAAVIPSLAGEGISIAIASGIAAARAWLEGGAAAAPIFQRDFAACVRRPVAIAGFTRRLAENRTGSIASIAAARSVPPLMRALMRATRIDLPPASLALPHRPV